MGSLIPIVLGTPEVSLRMDIIFVTGVVYLIHPTKQGLATHEMGCCLRQILQWPAAFLMKTWQGH
jgi:hypothetical protein